MAGYPRKIRTQLRWKHWSYGAEVLCGFTDGEDESRRQEKVMLVILEQMSRKFVYSRRMKGARSTTRGNCFGKRNR